MTAKPFSSDLRGDPGAATIAMRGDINIAAEGQLADAYAGAAATGSATVILDFSEVEYINSTGIALIVRLLADARRDGRAVRALGLSPHYVEVFEITRLSDYMQIIDDAASPDGRAVPATAGGQT